MARKREYWLQIENHPWDADPWKHLGRSSRQSARGSRGASGSGGDHLIIRRYTAQWGRPDDRLVNP